MTYRIPLPRNTERESLDLVEPFSTSMQRVIRHGGLAGYERSTQAAVLASVEKRFSRGLRTCMLDVGANIGLYSAMVASIFPGSVVHAFEPTPSTAEIARKIVAANGLDISIVQAAVGASRGTATLHVSAVSDSSNSLVEGFRSSLDEFAVELLTIDDYCDTHGLAPTLIKLDVEAFEPEVLKGAVRSIARFRPTIVIEVLASRGPEHAAAINDVMDGLGYHFHPLVAEMSLVAQPAIVTSASGGARDWLLTPGPLDADFGRLWADWAERVAECTPERNSRPPVLRSVSLAYERGGVREVIATGRRQAARIVAARRRSLP